MMDNDQDKDPAFEDEIENEPIPPGPNLAEDDTLEFEKMERKPRRLTGMWVVLVAAAIIGAGAGAWAVMGDRGAASGDTGVPVIRPEPRAFKTRPESPGGMKVPDRDKLVYDRLSSSPPAEPPERLLPQPETPLPPPGNSAAGSEPSESPAVSEPPEPATTIETASAPTVEEVNATEPPPPAPEPPNPQVAARKVLMTGAFRVQLGAVRSQNDAELEWVRLRKRHPDLLEGLELVVTRADLGEKGIFYRLRAGPLSDRAAARKLCDDLSEKKVACLVVRPGT